MNSRAKLQELLTELFQFNNADLDFGIYRIMNLRREELQKFIDKDLLDAIAKGFEEIKKGESQDILEELANLRNRIMQELDSEAFTADGNIKEAFRNTKLAKEYEEKKSQLADVKISEELEIELFSDIYTFFSRYWDEGDFISRRRYSREAKYAIPYNGEEVMLYWANNDQYYIKTGEYFNDYTFKVETNTVHFKIAAAETEQNNTKGEKRFFLLYDSSDNIRLSDTEGSTKELIIQFRYRPLTEQEIITYGKQKQQEKINETVCQKILNTVADPRLKVLLAAVKENEERSLLAKHLYRYTKKNTTDYFIHKDLKRFLERELDFFLKNEVMMIDALGTEKEVHFDKYLTKVRVLKQVCLKIIAFLAQLEDFQKKLFEKRKFVLETNYCVTLDNVPEKFYDEILKNDNQLNAWKELFALPIDIKKKVLVPQEIEELKSVKQSKKKGQQPLGLKHNPVKLDKIWLKKNQSLVIDTKYYNSEFRNRLLNEIGNLESKVNGLLIKSDNLQALNLLREKLKNSVKCIYIDPPYNRDNDDFVYKDNYRHSSWLAMMEDRIRASRILWADDGHFFASIDKNEQDRLRLLLSSALPGEFVSNIANVNNPQGRSDEEHIATAHESLLIFVNEESASKGWPAEEKVIRRYRHEEAGLGKFREVDLRKTGKGDRRIDRPNLFYYFYYNSKTNHLYPSRDQNGPKEYVRIVPIRPDGTEGRWRWKLDESEKNIKKLMAKPMEMRDVWTVYEKDVLENEPRITPTSVWDKKSFNSQRASDSFTDLGFDKSLFEHPKPVDLMKHILEMSTEDGSQVLDYFAGTGTTAQALLTQDLEKGWNRKYTLVEIEKYFEPILKPRIQKIMYSTEWKDGKPIGKEGVSHIFKYQTLESYEDTLNNIELHSKSQGGIFEDYTLQYMLTYESRASTSLLNVDKMSQPFDYELDVYERGERKRKKVDLIETFNYLLGLEVNRIRTYRQKNDELRIYQVVFGSVDGKTTVVIWRNTVNLNLEADREFIENEILKGESFDQLYINGDNFVPNSHPIEKTFKERMFAPLNV